MNNLEIAVLIICVICVIVGYKKGIVKIVLSLVATIITIFAVLSLTPKVSTLIMEYTPLDESLTNNFVSMILGDDIEGESLEGEIPRQLQIEMIEQSTLPEKIKEVLLTNNNTEIYARFGVSSFAQYIGSYLSRLAIRVVSFIITLILVMIFVKVAVSSIEVIANLPMLYGINRVVGSLFGLGFALIIVWILFLLITLFGTSNLGIQCLQWVEESGFLGYIYENNFIMKILL